MMRILAFLAQPSAPTSRAWGVSLIVVATVLVGVSSSAASERKRFDRYGIAFEYPSGWSATTRPLSNGTNPVYRFAVSSVPVRRTREDVGPCLPGIARQIPADAVLAYLREAVGSDRARSLPRMPRRPRSFRLPARADSYLCGFERGTGWIPFKQAGRAFYLGLYVGARASAPTRRALARLLDGMRIHATY
jgi:hypothetical protein